MLGADERERLKSVIANESNVHPGDFCQLAATAIRAQLNGVREIIGNPNPQRVIEREQWVQRQSVDQRQALAEWEMQAENSRYAWAVAATDAAAAMIVLLEHDDEHHATNSHLTLARVIVESAVNYYHITERSLSFNEALLHQAALIMEEIRQGNLLASVRDLDDKATTDGRIDEIKRMKDEAHIVDVIRQRTNPQAKPRIVGLERDGVTVPLQFSATDVASEVLRHPSSKAPYRLGSAATHAAWWFITPDHPHAWPPPQKGYRKVLEATTLAIDALTAMARAWESPASDDRVQDVIRSADGRIDTLEALVKRMPEAHQR